MGQRQAGELHVQIGDVVTMLVSKKQPPGVLHHSQDLDSCPRIGPPRGMAAHHFERNTSLVGQLLEAVELDLVPVNPGRRNGFVEKSPADSDDAMKAAVLVEREQRLCIGLQSMAKLADLSGLQVATQLRFVAEWPADAAGPLDQEFGGDAQGATAPVDLPGFLRRR